MLVGFWIFANLVRTLLTFTRWRYQSFVVFRCIVMWNLAQVVPEVNSMIPVRRCCILKVSCRELQPLSRSFANKHMSPKVIQS